MERRGQGTGTGLTVARARDLAPRLVQWYRVHARDLPWRHRRDPYAIWVSEVMLQQTRVEAVVGRYQAFLRQFPDLPALAAAEPAEVLAAWAGLGYYRRARQMHAAARAVLGESGGSLPSTAAMLRLLPGFGAYTAGAVASIAFDEPVPAVDGNVERVLSRLLALPGDPARGEAARTVRSAAQRLVECEPPHLLNQALMELGALVCTPRSPRCAECPWQDSCAANATGSPESFPRKPPPRESVAVTAYAAIQRDPHGLFWRRRPEGGHNAGLWELPTTPWHGGAPDERRARQLLSELGRELGQEWTVGEPVVRVRHGITHHRITVVGYGVDGPRRPLTPDLAWADPADADALGLTAAASKLLRKLPTLL